MPTLTFVSSRRENDLETIEFVISKGERFKLVHLAITGNKYFDVDTIRERMFMEPAALNLRRGTVQRRVPAQRRS